MGLIAGLSVASIIELALTIVSCLRNVAYNAKIAPETMVRPKRQKRFLVNRDHVFYHFGQNFVEFLKESSIHGVRYINEKKFKGWERIAWAIIVCVSFAFSSVLIMESLSHLQSNSVSVVMDEKVWTVEEVRYLLFRTTANLNCNLQSCRFHSRLSAFVPIFMSISCLKN